MNKLASFCAALGLAAVPLHAATYEIDPAHSTVMFRVRHLVGKVTGRFEKFSGTFDYVKDDPAAWSAQAEIDAASINTGVGARDQHLRSADFFDVEKCTKLIFKSTKVSDVKDGKAKLYGDLTMRCVTRPVALDLEIGEEMKDPKGIMKAGMSATGKLNRKDFGLAWNKVLETGGVMVGEEVEITIDVEAAAKKEEPKKTDATK